MRRVGKGRLARLILSVSGVAGLLAAGTGCQSKLADENKQLWQENRELHAKMDERSSSSAPAPAPMIAEPKPAPPPEPHVTQVAPPPVENVVIPPPSVGPMPVDDPLKGEDVKVEADKTTINFLGDALFDPGKDSVKATAKSSLDKVVAALKKQYAGKPVMVQGHTDSDPIKKSKWASNMELSNARAESVKKYLVSKGVDSSRITSEGFGDTKPKDTSKGDAAKAKNRRVEIVVVTK